MGKLITKIKTNSTPDSVFHVRHDPVKFAALWANYPDYKPYIDPKTGEPPQGYSNQCAIKVSVAFHKSGIEMKSFTAKTIGVSPKDFGRVEINGKATATLAVQLAAWLNKRPFCGLPQQPENITGEDWGKKIKGRTGIIYFEDYWMRTNDNESQPTGDHIDLWNGSRLTATGFSFISTTGRSLGIDEFFPGTSYGYSNLSKSRKILAWEVR